MSDIQSSLITYFSAEEDTSVLNFENLIKLLYDFQIRNNKHDLKIVLHIILRLSNDFHRNPYFYNRIFNILKNLEKEIKTFFTNDSIFNIFKGNKRILLFLIEEKILFLDKSIISIFKSTKYFNLGYPDFFIDEIAPFESEEFIQSIKDNLLEDYQKFRKYGESHFQLCQFVRNNQVDEFSSYLKQNNYDVNIFLNRSLFDTNSFLLKDEPTLIEYAFFYGSVDIINFMVDKNVELTSKLWLYAVHSNNKSLFDFLHDYKIQPPKSSYKSCFYECLKCHNNDLATYIQNKYLQNAKLNNMQLIIHCLKYYNFNYIKDNEFIEKVSFYTFCKYDYFYIVNELLKKNDININDTITINKDVNNI